MSDDEMTVQQKRRRDLDAMNELGRKLIEENPEPKRRPRFVERDPRHAKVKGRS